MSGSPEGPRPQFDRTPQQRTPTEHLKPQQEGGSGAPGIPPTLNERAKPPPESQERQTLPSVWDVLEREVRLYDPALPQVTGEEYSREIDEISRLQEEREEKGITRDHLITDLYWTAVRHKKPSGRSPLPLEHLTL